jgi:hypothetical protein
VLAAGHAAQRNRGLEQWPMPLYLKAAPRATGRGSPATTLTIADPNPLNVRVMVELMP